MPIDASIPLSYKPVDGLANLSSLLDTRKKMLELNKSTETYDSEVARIKADSSTAQSGASTAEINLGERKALQQALADPTQYTGADGKMDFNKALPLIMKAAPTTGMDHVKNMMATQEQSTNSSKAILGLGAEKMGQLGNFAYSLRGKPQDVQEQAISSLEQHLPMLAEHLPYFQKSMKQARDSGGQEGVDRLLSQFGRQMQSAPNQQTMNTPNAVNVSDGAKSFGVNIKPDVQDMPQYAPVPGLGATQQPGPTAEIINSNGSKRMIGPSPGRAPGERSSAFNSDRRDTVVGNADVPPASPQQEADNRLVSDIAGLKRERARATSQIQLDTIEGELKKAEARQRQVSSGQPQNYQTSLPTGQAENIKDNVDSMNTHFAKLSGAASDAQLALSLTSSIKTLAKDAITGTTSGRQSYVNGLLNSFKLGNQATGDLQKDTDLLEKYLAQLNLTTPAASDAARTLISAARPHGTMKDTAIIEAADQISSVIHSNLAIRDHLSTHKLADGGKGDAVAYQKARSQIEGLADPRIFQLRGKSAQEQKDFMGKLTQSDRAELVRKSRALHDLGVTE